MTTIEITLIELWLYSQIFHYSRTEEPEASDEQKLTRLIYRVVVCISQADSMRKQSSGEIQTDTLNVV